ncbi:MAG: glycosyltransferase family 4 protein [Gammaproteobacteria bacterium]|nr:glycosyltransferase family 4 protein [Gammaproteobacteria bacterium]
MRILINMLSIGSLSGEHVAFGFTGELLQKLTAEDRIFILHYRSQRIPDNVRKPAVTLVPANDGIRHWMTRSAWEPLAIRRLVRQKLIHRVVGFAGVMTPFLSLPQVVLAQNPWAFVREARSGVAEEAKAYLQRRAYRTAYLQADHALYVSGHLRNFYNKNFEKDSAEPAPASITYEGLDDGLFEATRRHEATKRKPFSVLSVSAYARWKGVETTVQAIGRLRNGGVPATLSLVGPWVDQKYEQRIRSLVERLSLADAVTFFGKVKRSELDHHYASHQVFCLMSYCESFGIPSAEAMAFGTPVVSTDACAIAEVCAGAGRFGPPGDSEWTAEALTELLTDQSLHDTLSAAGRTRAAQLTWAKAAKPLVDALGLGKEQDTQRRQYDREASCA